MTYRQTYDGSRGVGAGSTASLKGSLGLLLVRRMVRPELIARLAPLGGQPRRLSPHKDFLLEPIRHLGKQLMAIVLRTLVEFVQRLRLRAYAKTCILFTETRRTSTVCNNFHLDNTIPAPQNEEDSNGAGEPQSLDFPLSYAAGSPKFVRGTTTV